MMWIAERLEDLNTSYDDICEARVTFAQQGRYDAVGVDQEVWQAPSAIVTGEATRIVYRL